MKKKLILSAMLFVLVAALLGLLALIYGRLHEPAGRQVAQAAVIVLVQGVMLMFFLGAAIGGFNVWALRTRNWIFKEPARPGTWQERYQKLWGYQPAPQPVAPAVAYTEAPRPELDPEVIATKQRPRKSRGGRVHTYPYEVRKRTVLDWENRPPMYHLTLPQFLAERHGTTSTGLLNVPVGTFYEWRKDILGLDKPAESEE